jgi:hypothetical protein
VWIQFRPPIPHDAASLIERGMLFVHPLKGTPEGDEKRSVFRKNREAAVSGQRPASSGRQPAGGTQ